MKLRTRFSAAGKASVVLLLMPPALGGAAQPEMRYPERPVRMVVSYAAGGGSDMLARLIAPRLAQDSGQSFIIDNRPGGNSTIGTQLTAKAPKDGYTIGVIDTALAINAQLYEKLPYDALKDFAGVALLATSPLVLVVHPAVPARSVKELVALAKSKPGQIAFAAAGSGTATSIASYLFKRVADIDIIHVPYKGGAPSATALLGGEVQASFATLPIMFNHVKAGKARVLAVAGPRRFSMLPDVPTLDELGIQGVQGSSFWGVVAPAGTPQPIIQQLNAMIVRYNNTPEVKSQLVSMYFDPGGNTGSAKDFDVFLKQQIARWSKAVRESGAKPD